VHHQERRSAPAADAATAAFLFADIAGYTALTEAHGDEQAADLVAEFFEAISEELPTWGGTHVKTIGAAVMLRTPTPDRPSFSGCVSRTSCCTATAPPQCALAFTTDRRSNATATTSAPPSNLAARVAADATGGEVLLTAHTAALAPALDGILYQPRGRQTLSDIREPVELFAAISQGQPDHGKLPIDPVCQMAVDPKHSVARLIFEDTAYFFCTLACAAGVRQAPRTIHRLNPPPGRAR
jgi:class 3 adenylate cyclase/YHS domain-containing protein